MTDFSINLLKDTEDPEREAVEKPRYHPPKLSDRTPKAPKGPNPTSKSPKRSVGGFLREFFGIKPKAPVPTRILTSKPEAPTEAQSASTPVPFQPAYSSGSSGARAPGAEEFTIAPRPAAAPNPSPIGAPAPIRGEPMLEDLLAEPPPMIGTPGVLHKPAPPPPSGEPVKSFVAAPTPLVAPRQEGLLEDVLAESTFAPPNPPSPKPSLPPLPGPKPPTPPPSRTTFTPPPTPTTFSQLPLSGKSAAPVKRAAPPVGARLVPNVPQRIGMRIRTIFDRFVPKRAEKLPVGETADDLDVNLIPEELSARLKLGDKLISLGLTALVVVMVIAAARTGLNLVHFQTVVEKEKISTEIDALRVETLRLQSEQRAALEFKNRADAVKFALARHVHWTQFFQSLEQYTERDVHFVNFNGDLSGNLALASFGTSFDSIARQYTTFLGAKDFVEKVSITGAQRDPKTGVVSFTVLLTLVPTFYLEPPA
jgi:phage terminase Nu1 subunit (DNA packaging protein)